MSAPNFDNTQARDVICLFLIVQVLNTLSSFYQMLPNNAAVGEPSVLPYRARNTLFFSLYIYIIELKADSDCKLEVLPKDLINKHITEITQIMITLVEE